MNIAERVIQRFGGVRALARALEKPPTTVQGWKDRGIIPAQHQAEVLAAAKRAAIALTPNDFFEAA